VAKLKAHLVIEWPMSNTKRTQGKMAMTQFVVGDQVVIRYGKHQGEKARILKSIRGYDYKLKTEEGFVLFYSGKGLVKAPAIC
jgi:hypothetical protein